MERADPRVLHPTSPAPDQQAVSPFSEVPLAAGVTALGIANAGTERKGVGAGRFDRESGFSYLR